ncbi:MAG: DUF4230 domain-containing protein [Erysipelotrichaceae bacterium]|nr:DUF4230 domain-containing protein [Erysipelotrichaceae bacterium]
MKNKIILLLCALVVALGCFIGGAYFGEKKVENTLDSATIEASMAEIQELATMEYAYTNMGKFESSKEFKGIKIPFTTSKYIITYDGVIKAGYDLSKATVSVNGNEVTITLPDVEVLSHTIDYDSLQIMDEQYSIFNQVEITDYNGFYAEQSKLMEEKAINKGLFEKAEVNGKTMIESLIAGLSNEEMTVIFK